MTDPHPGADAGIAARLSAIVRAQHGLAVELERLTAGQRAVVESDDGQALLQLLARRQSVIDQLSAATAELEPYRARWASLLSVVPPGRAAELQRTLAETGAIVSRVREGDRHDHASLMRRRDALRQEMDTLDAGKDASAAYDPAPPRPQARLTDREA